MASVGKIARRTFLFGSLAIAGGVAFGVWQMRKTPPNPLMPAKGETALSPFVLIDADGVTLIAPRAEMGQGTQTTWAALLAEELDLDWQDIRVIHGPPAKAYYNQAMVKEALPNKGYDASAFQQALAEAMGDIGKVLNLQITGGSTAMKDGFERMRIAGAAAREMLKQAAANRLGVDTRRLKTEGGAVIAPDGTVLPYPDLAEDAAGIDPPNIALRPRSDWKLLGRSLPRIDMVGKSTGTAAFGIDTRLPGMKFAALRMSPRRGAMTSFDATEAERMPGVEKIVDMGGGVAVIASNTWLAQQAADAIVAEWAEAAYPADSAAMFDAIEAAFDARPNSTMRDDGDVTALPDGATEITASYKLPFLAHATMEPMNATAWLDGDLLRVWCGTQAPAFARDACADEAGIDADRVDLETTLMGGGFGRRGELDFSVLATRVAKAVPGTPVNVTWSREEDMTHDHYRPAALARMRGAVKDGRAVMLDLQVAAPSAARQAIGRWTGFRPAGPDMVHVEGLFDQPYGVPNYRVRGHLAEIEPPLGFWRSVGNSYNGFFHESFMDEMAHAAGADPLEFRLALARGEWAPAAGVLEAVREMSGWTGQTPQGTGRGVAMTYSFGTPVAMVIEVQNRDGAIRLTDAWIAVDPGIALDPGIIEAQMTGGMVYGLSAAIGEEITFADGMVEQMNFPDYEPLRITQMPAASVRILQTQDRLSGVGEVATPPAAPALANAIFDLTGQRARQLPLRRKFAFYV